MTESFEDVLDKAKLVLDFSSKDHVHVAMAIARNKYNPEIGHQANDYKKGDCVFREVLNENNWDNKLRKLYTLATNYSNDPIKPEDFVIYVTVNPRSLSKAKFLLEKEFISWREHGTEGRKLKRVDAYWVSCLQKPEARATRNWFLFDVDMKDYNTAKNLKFDIIDSADRDDLMMVDVETRNGYHVMSTPFNLQDLVLPKYIECKKDAMVMVFRND